MFVFWLGEASGCVVLKYYFLSRKFMTGSLRQVLHYTLAGSLPYHILLYLLDRPQTHYSEIPAIKNRKFVG